MQRDKNTKELLPIEFQPHILQFWGIRSEIKKNLEIKEKEVINELFNPWITIPEEMTKIHWISNDMIKWKPDITKFLRKLIVKLNDADYIVWHNVNFDIDMLEVELIRLWYKSYKDIVSKWRKKVINTMFSSIEFCEIPCWYNLTLNENKEKVLTLVWKTWNWLKWPKLSELHIKLFEDNFDNPHNALWDIYATQKCFVELVKRWIIKI